jgi:hypothetical protein
MAIGEIPASLAELERPNVEYEASRFASTAAGRRLAHAQRYVFLAWFPWPPWRLGGRAISALFEERVAELLDLARPTRAERRAAEAALQLHARTLRLLPPRRRPRLLPGLHDRGARSPVVSGAPARARARRATRPPWRRRARRGP